MSSQGRFRQRLSTLAADWRVLALRGLAALILPWWTGQSYSCPRSGPPIEAREGGFHWPKEQWVSLPVWWLFSGPR